MHKQTSAQWASTTDLKRARTNALKMSGVPLEELQRQASRDAFTSSRTRLAWLTVRGIDQALQA